MNASRLLTTGLLLALAVSTHAQGPNDEVTTPFFGNKTCPVTGKPAKAALSVKHGDEHVFVCCKGCIKKVAAKPKVFHAKAYPAAKVNDLGNEKCPVMGGKAKEKVSTVFQGHRVHFCCPGCDKSFLREPNKHLARMTSKKKLTDLGNKTCPVMAGNKVEPDSFVIYKGQIINICCAGCAKKFAKSPAKYLEAMKKGKALEQWTCSMHPEVIADMPGKCPKCGMDLITVKPEKDRKHD